MADREDHRGNIQPFLDLEEHSGTTNSKRTITVSAPTALTSFASISNTPTVISDTNNTRTYLLVRNISNTTIFIGFASTMTLSSMYLKQDDVYIHNSTVPFYGLVSSGAGEVRFTEESI